MVESSTIKWPQKEEIEAEKKISGKIVMGKEAKGFDPIECYIKGRND
jgi:hypothetical protein